MVAKFTITIVSVIAALLVASFMVTQPIAQAQEQEEQENSTADSESTTEETTTEDGSVGENPYNYLVGYDSPYKIFAKFEGLEDDQTSSGYMIETEIVNYWFEVLPDDSLTINERGAFSSISIVKPIDSSSPMLMVAAGMQEELEEIEISVRKSGDSADSMKLILVDATIHSLRHTSESENWSIEPTYPWETLTVSYDKIYLVYQPLDNNGNPVGEPSISGWDTQRMLDLDPTEAIQAMND